MSKAYKIVFKNGTDEIVEKKSRFIANVFAVESEEEVLEIIEMKRIVLGVDHHCSLRIGYRVGAVRVLYFGRFVNIDVF